MGLFVFNWSIQVYVIERIHLSIIILSSSIRKYMPIQMLLYIRFVCDKDGCSITFCQLFHKYPGKDVFRIITVQPMMYKNTQVC